MAKAPRKDPVDQPVRVGEPEHAAAGLTAVAVSMKRSLEQMTPLRTAKALARVNHHHGFDCPGCAWPEPDGVRRRAEFCENGAKAVAEEATQRVVGAAFFAKHSVAELHEKSGYWLGQQGRIAEPMVLWPGETHYRPLSWDEAYAVLAEHLTTLPDPDHAVFYTSGRTSNEAAYLYQAFARSLGTNNLPDCSNMCHESSGIALTNTIGIGKGSVTVEDLTLADLIVIAGQNPGTNHPRMLTQLRHAKNNGAVIVAVNPLPEAGLLGFMDPQSVGGALGRADEIADELLQIRIGGDQALFQGVGHLLVRAEDEAPGTVLDAAFIESSTSGVQAYVDHLRAVDLAEVVRATGLGLDQLERFARRLIESERTIGCWAMGLTQQPHAVATIEEFTNLLLLRGMIGKPGAGVCPVRGHSNVQGDRTVGIYEQMPEWFHDALDAEFAISSPREHGYDTVNAIRAMSQGKVEVFMGMGGNFARATPDTELTEEALRSCRLTVQISTKLNHSHTATGRTALILPTLGRSDRDEAAGVLQHVSVEDSMSMVHLSTGRLKPVSPHLRSEVRIVSELAQTVLGEQEPWAGFAADYDMIRDSIERVVPGFEQFNQRVRRKGGFVLPHPPRDSREFQTASGRAEFAVNELQWLPTPPGGLILQTLRSHDQFNTTVYGLDDRYRGIKGNRKVVMVNPEDLAAFELSPGDKVTLVSLWPTPDGVQERRAPGFEVVAYPTPVGNAAAYYPETNALVPLDYVAKGSNTPASKALSIRLERE